MENKYNLILVVFVVAVGLVLINNIKSPQITGGVVVSMCGDAICDMDEDMATCPEDCGYEDPCMMDPMLPECGGGPICGDAICDVGEDDVTCSADCQPEDPCMMDPMLPECGGCDEADPCADCDADGMVNDECICYPEMCAPPGPFCGDAICDEGEECDICSEDCGDCVVGAPPDSGGVV